MTPLRVLVVEDDVLIGLLLADVLAGMGHDVCTIESTEAGAVTAAARYQPDLMIVDVGLRCGNGISAIAEILHTRFVPHVFVSGDLLGVQAIRPDAVIIQKPFRETDLARAIQRALDGPILRPGPR